MKVAFDYLRTNGIGSSNIYPYRGSDLYPCTFNKSFYLTNVTSSYVLPPGNETMIKLVLATVGPLAVGIDASLLSFHSYRSGIYSDPLCTNILNHAMLLVGLVSWKSFKPFFKLQFFQFQIWHRLQHFASPRLLDSEELLWNDLGWKRLHADCSRNKHVWHRWLCFVSCTLMSQKLLKLLIKDYSNAKILILINLINNQDDLKVF